jgi:hypothetical protein
MYWDWELDEVAKYFGEEQENERKKSGQWAHLNNSHLGKWKLKFIKINPVMCWDCHLLMLSHCCSGIAKKAIH